MACTIYPTAVFGFMAAGTCAMVSAAEAAAAGERTLSAFTFGSSVFDKCEEPTEAPTFNTPSFRDFKSTNDDGDEGDEGHEGDEGEGKAMPSHKMAASFFLFS